MRLTNPAVIGVLVAARPALAFSLGRTSSTRVMSAGLFQRTSHDVCLPFVGSRTLRHMSGDNGDDDDDWFSDYDPSVYRRYDNDRNSNRNNDDEYGNRPYGRTRRHRRSANYNRVGHDYTRDTSRDNSNVDVDQVNDLLAARLRARRTGDYDRADEIRDQLLSEHTVVVFDRERTWRSGMSPSYKKTRGRHRGGFHRNFGPNGHDYNYSPDAGPNSSTLQDEEIHELLAERLLAKLNRDFETADQIQHNLVQEGVYVHDASKQWRADGIPFGDKMGGGYMQQNNRNNRRRPYTRSEFSLDVDEEDERFIADLVQKRATYKERRDYLNADSIRDDLQDRFNVQIDDRLREWSAGGDFGESQNQARAMSQSMRSRPYAKSPSSSELSAGLEQNIQARVDERMQAKRDGNFDLADSIRDELMEDYNVVIHDKIKMWSVGGDFGDELPKRRGPGDYVRRGGGNLTDDEVKAITAMVSQRFQAKRDRDYDLADQLRDFLRSNYKISIDDRNREWRVDSDDYVQAEIELGATQLTSEQVAAVQAKIKERAAFKREQNYDAADEIRDELMASYSVKLDDRTKEWKVAMSVGNYKFANERKKQNSVDEDFDDALDSILESVEEEISSLPQDVTDDDDSDEGELETPPQNEESIDSSNVHEVGESNREELSKLTVVQLKEKLRDSGKPVSGRKEELISRLLEV